MNVLITPDQRPDEEWRLTLISCSPFQAQEGGKAHCISAALSISALSASTRSAKLSGCVWWGAWGSDLFFNYGKKHDIYLFTIFSVQFGSSKL